MARSSGISGLGVTIATAGGFLLWTGLRNVGVLDGLRSFAAGRLPAGNPRPPYEVKWPSFGGGSPAGGTSPTGAPGRLTHPVFPGAPVSQRYSAGHPGVDYAMPWGTPVGAAASGRVSAVTSMTGSYGKHVRIDHGWGETLYAHLATFNTTPDATVNAGQKIGTIGSTGKSTGPHLHFEVRVGGKHVDPSSLVGLLPPGPGFHAGGRVT